MIVLDTHVLVWLGEANKRLGAKASTVVDKALRDDELVVSAISFWEVAMLAAKSRVELEGLPEAFRRAALERGIQEIPIDGAIGISAVQLDNFHSDPADRIITATTISLSGSLLTADERLLGWRGGLKVQDARR